jgi:hypothetical protein
MPGGCSYAQALAVRLAIRFEAGITFSVTFFPSKNAVF